jgi:hypothetical protein
MSRSPFGTISRKLCFVFLLVALVLGISFSGAPKVMACGTCLSETGAAYNYCYYHPDGQYNGCNFSTACDGGRRSANQIYRDECCDMPVHDGGWTIYCL